MLFLSRTVSGGWLPRLRKYENKKKNTWMLLVNAFSGQINEPMKITIPYAT